MSVIVATLVSLVVIGISLAVVRGAWRQFGELARSSAGVRSSVPAVRELRFTLTETQSIPNTGRVFVLPVRTQPNRQLPGLRAAA